ncbi:outer membrane protein assembly factor BamB family protein [Haladaptatus litoreus]|uniref:outer membrane protein assembly factor BamB family protein n=1 Tax=Haladaptatus litoreus TaxID=553468 RepID=UPI00158940FB|nr:PQQ-binding-like beta-propeller repeat protein [Haladaptatus litoreus]
MYVSTTAASHSADHTVTALSGPQQTAQPSQLGADDWPSFQRDTRNTGHNAGAVGVLEEPETNSTKIVDSNLRLSATAIRNDSIYLVGENSVVQKIDQSTKEVEWTADLGTDYDSYDPNPSLGSSTLLISGTDMVTALDPSDGDVRWEYGFSGDEASSVTVGNGVAYLKTIRESRSRNGELGTFHAVDVETGDLLWRTSFSPSSGQVSPSTRTQIPAVADGVAYFTGLNTLNALDVETGEELWTYTARDLIGHAPTVANGNVYVHGLNALAIDATEGTKVWETELDARMFARSPAVANGIVFYININHPTLWALDAKTGEMLWTFEKECDGGVTSAPALTSDAVYMAYRCYHRRPSGPTHIDDRVQAWDLESGCCLWSKAVAHDGYWQAPAVVNDTLYVTGRGGELHELTNQSDD